MSGYGDRYSDPLDSAFEEPSQPRRFRASRPISPA